MDLDINSDVGLAFDFGHNLELCNCDWCRYRRWENTEWVKVEVVELPPGGFDLDEVFNNYRNGLSAFLEREATGEIKAPSGPFTEENGWKRTKYGIEWGGGPVS